VEVGLPAEPLVLASPFGTWTGVTLSVRDIDGAPLATVPPLPAAFTPPCILTWCGDGEVQPERGESCDDGGRADFDGCSAACAIERCGDGVLQPGEACDDGNLADRDGCDAACVLEGCGDGVHQPELG